MEKYRDDFRLRSKRRLLGHDFGIGYWVRSHCPKLEKMTIDEENQEGYVKSYSSTTPSSIGGDSSDTKPQDADYKFYNIASLSDDLESLILARVSRSAYWKASLVNKRFLELVKSGEVFKIRRQIGYTEPSVFILADGEDFWWSFDRYSLSLRTLPLLPSDVCFPLADKESFCAGTHLFVSGLEYNGTALWRYELTTNRWFKGPSMISPRCTFASATHGALAFVAGGLDTTTCKEVLDSAEKYNQEDKLWRPLPNMTQKRRHCSGCCMENKFYVIGGQDEHQNYLTSGEYYDEHTNTWNLIPDMLKGIPVSTSQSPPLIAVANDELYLLDTFSNTLKWYLKESNTWNELGPVPVRADANRGWGVAFKSLGQELLLIGANSASEEGHGVTIYTCYPNPAAEKLQWNQIEYGVNKIKPFIKNCAVMVA